MLIAVWKESHLVLTNHTWGVVGVAVGLFIHLASIYKPLLGSKYRTKCWKYSRAQNKELIVNE